VTKNPEHYALVIGIDAYSQLPPLKSAVSDAKRFVRWLQAESGGGLSRSHIHALLSSSTPTGNSLNADPTQADVDQALAKIIQTNRDSQIKRLYFYFAGHGYGPSFDDVGMLMANASMSRLSSISLRAYRQFLRQSGHFPEIVFVLDCSRAYLLDGAPAPAPSLALTPSNQSAGSNDFVLMASSHGEQAFEITEAMEGGRRGLLTTAVLEGLGGEAIDSNQRITALSLSNYVRWRVPKLAGGASLKQLPEILLPMEQMVFAEKSATSKQLSSGTLIVEVPHWAAVIRIYDNVFRSISAGEIKAAPESPGLYLSETNLPEGIYRVEVMLEGQSANQLVSISLDAPARLARDSWGLTIDSTAPLQGTAVAHEKHMNPAAEWSHKHTWKDGPGGASRLFLFVRTSDPKRYKKFADGLQLLDANQKLITDFSTGVERNKKEGWMAFCADLPPGFYILRRGRRGIPLRYQPLYLCANWQTQVFLKARTAPSLSRLTVNMASYDKGFVPDDETAIAAEAVLDGMKRGLSGKRLVTGSKLHALLHGKLKNPWLGILAAYALRSDDTFSELAPGRAEERSSAALLKQVMNFLSTIKDHPDVRALELKAKKKSDPFQYPPMLYAGLKLVQTHATQFSSTIPLDSLTDRILDELVITSPWTAWRELAVTDRVKPKPVKKKRRGRSLAKPAASPPPIAPLYLQASAQAPVLQFFEAGVQQGTTSAKNAPPEAALTGTASATAALYRAQVIDVAQRLTRSGEIEALSDTVALNPTQQLHDLLTNLKAKEISGDSGLPLARVEDALQRLVKISESPESTPSDPGKPLSKTEHIVLECALQRSIAVDEMKDEPPKLPAADKKSQKRSKKSPKGLAASVAPPGVAVPPVGSVERASGTGPLVSLEECILKIRAEADRILLKYKTAGSTPVPGGQSEAEDIAGRLRKISTWLLERASFTAITDSEGRIRSISGAFDALLNPPDSKVVTTLETQRQDNQRLWETALAAAPLGSSVLQNPVADPAVSPGLQQLTLRRTAMEEDTTQAVHAYLNVLRGKDASIVKPESAQQIDAVVPDLSLYASFFTYDTSPRLSEHVEMLKNITGELEQIVNA
jgi:hypothetical protein